MQPCPPPCLHDVLQRHTHVQRCCMALRDSLDDDPALPDRPLEQVPEGRIGRCKLCHRPGVSEALHRVYGIGNCTQDLPSPLLLQNCPRTTRKGIKWKSRMHKHIKPPTFISNSWLTKRLCPSSQKSRWEYFRIKWGLHCTRKFITWDG